MFACRGVFEVHRNGNPPDFCAGVQAHLSSCASPKVLEAVNKFLPKVPLNEVSRLSAWPSQFHHVGAREDHIALYFFAKDIERQVYECRSFSLLLTVGYEMQTYFLVFFVVIIDFYSDVLVQL